ncbi:carboxypeptidase M32 [Reyranella sp. CPCC 100927]|uniref:carboxypeptidase M32 n=1 Tax=Reyranella sp. CPCC 100927 TaxID=2599616 RepID=UPI0011B5C9FE|nr:carboxypeptidase M32 [Reyranella sp. CPCC 100927]TWT02080.1 carboxypeptidase M32 [Reyranella sp. CPCC 100927]
MTINQAYHDLEARFRRLSAIEGALAILGWDRATMMPAGSAEDRGEQTATLGVLAHEILTASQVGDLLAAAEAAGGLDAWQTANLREMRRGWIHATALSPALVEAMARATTKCEMAWRAARPKNDFASLKPHLQAVLDLVRETAQAKADKLGLSTYDALLDQYEPDGRAARIDALFAELEAFLPDLLQRVLQHQAARPAALPLPGPFPIEAQRQLGIEMMKAVGFDFGKGRLDVSAHPFTGGTPDDVRLTTRYDESDFARALMGVLHETGHAMYEAGLPAAWRHQPVGRARGMALHESQSLLLEMQACRGRAFITFAAPRMRAAFGGTGRAWDADNVLRLYTVVKPGFIRVDADEVTYPLHVILRYRLERALIAGDLALDDLPAAWNDGMQRSLGIRPPTDAEGCLQDIHWPDGAWGYFPTYTLGALAAAQLFQAAGAADPDIEPGLARGDFAPLYRWLRTNVHAKGASASTDDLLRAATGTPLAAAAFRRHVEQRYLQA